MRTKQPPLLFEHDDALELWRDCRVCRKRTRAALLDDGILCLACKSKVTWLRRGSAAATNANVEGMLALPDDPNRDATAADLIADRLRRGGG